MNPQEERFVVTGAGGFIGSNLVRALIEQGCQVVGIDNFVTGRRENVEALLDRFTLIEGDAGDPALLQEAFAGAHYVLHQAAIPSVPRSIRDPLATNRSCVDVTLAVLKAAQEAGVKRVVQAASSSAYGNTEVLPKVETMPTSPLSPYAVSKLAQEMYARAWSNCYGVETLSLRYFNVFGPHQDPNSDYAAVIPKFIRMMLKGKAPMINGDGEHSRDFTFIENVVHANLLGARAEGPILGETINVACGQRVSLNELVERINRVLGTTISPDHGPEREGDVRHSLADIEKAKQLIGYEPKVDFDTGLAKTAEWVKASMG
ncbi:MAG: SDR family oxidoreductase [Planctomycetota bacterium]|jgi:UDP-glucose 4-epimerase